MKKIRVGLDDTRVNRAGLSPGFTLVEVMVAILILTLVIAGVCYGYSEANRIATWQSMSQAAQSYAVEGMEQARGALWNRWDWVTNTGYGTEDELPPSSTGPAMPPQQDLLDIPIKGTPYSTNGGGFTNYTFFATNYIYVTVVTNSAIGAFPTNSLRQIKSMVTWTYPFTGQSYTNTVITLRASDQ
jgi:prepilin-type N-terminal cleavage/methylation domain-containing protein